MREIDAGYANNIDQCARTMQELQKWEEIAAIDTGISSKIKDTVTLMS